jgi:hypothetical protein
MLIGSAFGQNQKDLSIQYHSDGGKTVIDNDGKEQVTLVLNTDGLCTLYEVQIVGSQRVVRDEYVYDHENRITEKIDYSFSSGYKKKVITYDSRGVRSSVTTYESSNPHKKGNWSIVAQRSSTFDHIGRVVRWESKTIPGRSQYEHFHKISENTFNSDGTTTSIDKELDANGRVISTGRGTSKTRTPQEPFDFNIVAQMSPTARGFMVVSATEDLKNETYYEDNRIVQEKFYRFKSGWGDVHSTEFAIWYTFDYKYNNGKLVEQSVLDGEDLKSKRQVEYEGRKPVRFKRFYKQSSGSMKMVVKQGFTPAHETYFPQLTGDYNAGDNLSAFGDGTDEPLNEVYEAPQASVYETPSYSGSSANGIVQELESIPRQSLSAESLALDKESQALLDQIKLLANANSTENITDAQILHLALQQLVDSNREELKELNQKHLESQQSMFD